MTTQTVYRVIPDARIFNPTPSEMWAAYYPHNTLGAAAEAAARHDEPCTIWKVTREIVTAPTNRRETITAVQVRDDAQQEG